MSIPKWKKTAYSHPDDIPAGRWDRLMMSVDEYTAMVEERARRDALAPAVGDKVPDFSALRLGSDGSRTGEVFQLHQALGRPLGLVFGSYT